MFASGFEDQACVLCNNCFHQTNAFKVFAIFSIATHLVFQFFREL